MKFYKWDEGHYDFRINGKRYKTIKQDNGKWLLLFENGMIKEVNTRNEAVQYAKDHNEF